MKLPLSRLAIEPLFREIVRSGHGALAVADGAIWREQLGGFERAIAVEYGDAVA